MKKIYTKYWGKEKPIIWYTTDDARAKASQWRRYTEDYIRIHFDPIVDKLGIDDEEAFLILMEKIVLTGAVIIFAEIFFFSSFLAFM